MYLLQKRGIMLIKRKDTYQVDTEQEAVQHVMQEIESHEKQDMMQESRVLENGDIPPIPEGVYNDADYAMPTDDGLGYMPEIDEPHENIIFGKPSRGKEKKLKKLVMNFIL